MTVKLPLSPQLERFLAAEAARLGLLLDAYLLQIIENYASSRAADRQAPRPRRQSGLLQGKVGDAFFEPLPPEELAAWGS
jgi:hypothetical protein